MPRRRPEFEPGEAGAEEAKLKKFSDAGGSQILWLSDAGRIDFESRAVYIFFKVMMSSEESDFNEFCKNKLFRGLSVEDLQILFSVSRSIDLETREVLIQEGEPANELFILTKGSLEVMKFDPEARTGYLIDTLRVGDMVGEIAFIDRGIRSASVRAQSPSRVRCLPFLALDEFLKKSTRHSQIFIQLSKNITERLRSTSYRALDAVKKEVRENKTRADMGVFLVYIVTILCIFEYALNGLEVLIRRVPNTTYIALPLAIFVGISVLFMIRFSNLSWRQLGITHWNWKRALFEGVVFAIPVVFVALLVKYFLIHTRTDFANHALFEPFSLIQRSGDKNWSHWFGYTSLYWFIIIPVQELLARGVLQGFLEYFLTGKYRVFMSIIMSNLILSTVHLFLPIYFSLIVFFSGIYLGWIYSRTHNLISSWTAHIIMGTSAITFLGQLFITPY